MLRTRPSPGPPPPRTSARAGLTLVELVYVTILVGIMTAIAIPRIDFGRPRVDGAAMEIASHLMLAQRIAVLRQHDVRVMFEADRISIRLHHDADNDGVIDAGETTDRRVLGDGVAIAIAGDTPFMGSGEAATFAEGPEGLPTLTFHRNGAASEEGVVHLTTAPYSHGTDDRAVRVGRATGLTRCWSRRTGAWTEGC